MIDVYRADLHDVIFVGGKNLTGKLDARPKGTAGLKLQWDEEEDELVVTYQGETGRMPHTGVKIYFTSEGNEKHSGLKEVNVHQTQHANPAARGAQVSTPQGHVFAGPGAGKTGSK